MKKDLNIKAFSLLELIIASVLVVVVILGMFGVNNVLNNNNQDYGQRYLVKSETQATLNHILYNASLAVGSDTMDSYGNPDEGIVWSNGPGNYFGDAHSMCVHQSPSGTAGSSTDVWFCYSWVPSGGTPPAGAQAYQIDYCTIKFNPSLKYRGAASCFNPAAALVMQPTFLGTSYNDFTAGTLFNMTSGVFSVTLVNCLDNSQGCIPPGTATDPGVSLTGSIVPPQQGLLQS